jgi:hypothetical protein
MDCDEWAKTVGIHEEQLKALEQKYSKKATDAGVSKPLLKTTNTHFCLLFENNHVLGGSHCYLNADHFQMVLD